MHLRLAWKTRLYELKSRSMPKTSGQFAASTLLNQIKVAEVVVAISRPRMVNLWVTGVVVGEPPWRKILLGIEFTPDQNFALFRTLFVNLLCIETVVQRYCVAIDDHACSTNGICVKPFIRLESSACVFRPLRQINHETLSSPNIPIISNPVFCDDNIICRSCSATARPWRNIRER